MSVVNLIRSVIAQKDSELVSLHEPLFSGNEWPYVKECIDTAWVSSVGKYVDRFECDLADFTGARYAIATSNGTSALHISYLLAGIKPGDEVLVPTLTFVATTNALSYCGAIPHFIDAEPDHLGVDPFVLDVYLSEVTDQKNGECFNRLSGRPIRALCVMHTLGHPVDLDPLEQLCQKYNLILLEDAAEALGSYYKGVHVGHRGKLGALSFNGNKIITTGGGGAILTNDERLAKRAKHLTTTAKVPHPWLFQHDEVGYNYRLPNLNAALGCAQLEKMSVFLEAKRTLAQRYEKAFSVCPDARFLKEPVYAKSNYWLNAILLNDENNRDHTLRALNDAGIASRPLWNLQHTLPMYRDCPRMPLSVAEKLQKILVKIPSSVKLGM
jgi:perosamine synthetase